MTGRRSNQLSYYPKGTRGISIRNKPFKSRNKGLNKIGYFDLTDFINLGEIYSTGKFIKMNNLRVKKLELGPISTNAFLLWEQGGKEAVLIDAPPSCASAINPVLSENNLKLKEIWLTHGHWDHIAGVSEVMDDDTQVCGHPADELMFANPQLMAGFSIPGISLLPVKIDQWITDGVKISLWGREVLVLHCPGHCPGNVAFYIRDEEICFVGDVIFSGSIGRTDLPGGNFEVLEQSIQKKIYTLPDETELGVGHGPNTTVGVEKMSNPYVRG